MVLATQKEQKRRGEEFLWLLPLCGAIFGAQSMNKITNRPLRLSICHQRAVHKGKKARLF